MSLLYDTESEHFVSEDHRRIAEIIKDFDPNLELRFIPENMRTSEEERRWPFILVDNPPDKEPYLVMLLEQSEINAELIGRIFQSRIDPNRPMERLKAMADARKIVQQKKAIEEAEQLADFHQSLLKSPLHTYKHNGRVYG